MAAGERVLITFTRYLPIISTGLHCSCWRWRRGDFLRLQTTFLYRVLNEYTKRGASVFRSSSFPFLVILGEAAAVWQPFARHFKASLAEVDKCVNTMLIQILE